jgi:hypothetical protein
MMPKEGLTARELADKIRELLDDPNLRVGVFYDKVRGWYATAYSSTGTVAAKQARVNHIVRRLRVDYDLRE